MRINRIKLHNFRGIKDIEIIIGDKNAIFFGENGAGKTSILDACAIVISKALFEAVGDRQIEVGKMEKEDIYNGAEDILIELDISLDGKKYTLYRRRDEETIKKSKSITSFAIALRKKVGSMQATAESGRMILNKQNIPIFVFYGVNRYIRGSYVYEKKYGDNGKIDAWRDHICKGQINWDKFFEWFRTKQESENSIRLEDDINYQDRELKFARQAILEILGNDFKKIYIKINDKPEMYFEKNGKTLSASQLSDGELSSVSLAGDIARRIAIANPFLENTEQGEGIVLIDEIDLHLHPLWQERIMESLMKVFPNIQFLVTTHAPKVLNSVAEKVIIISLASSDGEIVADCMKPMDGWNVNEILDQYMGVDPLNKDTRKLINELHYALQNKEYGTSQKLAEILQEKTDGKNTEVIRARTLIGKGK